MATIGRALGEKPLVANMVEGGRTPMLSNARLAELGYALAIYPVAGLLAPRPRWTRFFARSAKPASRSARPPRSFPSPR